MLNSSVINKILFSRYLYFLAESDIKSDNPIKVATGIILLQDSVEIFLIGLAEHLEVGLPPRTEFDKYFIEINKKMAPKELPLKNKLLGLNKVRVSVKHDGVQPDATVSNNFLVSVADFYEEVCLQHFGQSLGSINLVNLLKEGEIKKLLFDAQQAYNDGNFIVTLINCRKVIFIEFEDDYSIEKLEPGTGGALAGMFNYSEAPYYAQNLEYIEKNVKDPTDYIVLDHNKLEMELMKLGIEHNDFGNVRRLTPEVYRGKKDKEWVVKFEFNKLDDSTLKSHAEYCLNKTIDIILKSQSKKEGLKRPTKGSYVIELKRGEVNVYEKADINSKVVAITPKELIKFPCGYYVRGLNDNDIYYHARYLKPGTYFSGFIHKDAIAVLQEDTVSEP